MRPAPFVWLVLLVLPLSGCLSDGPDDATQVPDHLDPAAGPVPGAAPDLQPSYTTVYAEGRTGTEAFEYAATEVAHDLEFDVLEGATAILVELSWADDVQDLDVLLDGPASCSDQVGFPLGYEKCLVDSWVAEGEYGTWWNKDGHAGAPDSPARILLSASDVERVGDGTWLVYAMTKDANSDLPFQVYATVFYGMDPAGFTALPA